MNTLVNETKLKQAKNYPAIHSQTFLQTGVIPTQIAAYNQYQSMLKPREPPPSIHSMLLVTNLSGPQHRNSQPTSPLSYSEVGQQIKELGLLNSCDNLNQLSLDQAVLEEAPLPTQMDKKASARSNGTTNLPTLINQLAGNSKTEKNSCVRPKELHG